MSLLAGPEKQAEDGTEPQLAEPSGPIVNFSDLTSYKESITTGPWYTQYAEDLYTGSAGSLCATCSKLNYQWLLSNDLTRVRSGGKKIADPYKSNYSLPLGWLCNIAKNEAKCSFCNLIIKSFKKAFDVENLFNEAKTSAPKVDDHVRFRSEYPSIANFRCETSIEDTSKAAFVIQQRTPELKEVNPAEAWLELDSRPITWGVFIPFPDRYGIRIWLCSAPNGRPIEHLVFQPIMDEASQLMGRLMSPTVDYDKVKNWVRLSVANNHTDFIQLPEDISSHFRLIDVFEERLVPMNTPCRYAALSYVWGPRDNVAWLENSLGTRKHFHEPGALSTHDPRLQATLRDAMVLVRNIGERYLWIDRLCITQDDEAGKMTQINQMDSIYRNAAFTIIAASGNCPTSGLPGISSSRPVRQYIAQVKDIVLGNRLPEFNISASPWFSRGWTFQEKIMSERKLTFTNDRVYFEDITGRYEEDLYEPAVEIINGLTSMATSLKGRGVGAAYYYEFGNDLFRKYCQICEDYTGKVLSESVDILNAFAGIATALGKEFKSPFVLGLPTSALTLALLWMPTSQLKRRSIQPGGNNLFATWSWAGWEGSAVRYELLCSNYDVRIKYLEDNQLSPLQVQSTVDIDKKMRSASNENQDISVPQILTLRISALCAPFKLIAERVRIRDFMAAKREYSGIRTYALEDTEANFAGAVCIHDPLVEPDYTLDMAIGPFDLVALLRSTDIKPDENYMPPNDDSDIEYPKSVQEPLRPFDRDLRSDHEAWLSRTSQWMPSLGMNDRHFYSSPFKRFYKNKLWSTYEVLIVRQTGEYFERIGSGRCFVEAFFRNGAVRKDIAII
ncbi:heterokaryon incompatibility protein-domain-containing protein [Bisporella sp. PMI_857]|nr:heterokaryon incompatibility protein-domain-containing protein [Bisporella sp. PMI_857]